MDDDLSGYALRVSLIAAALAALLILSGIFGDLISYICLAVVLAVAAWTAPERRRAGGGWWTIVGVGALLSLLGAGVAELSDSIGGILAVIGGALVVIGATMGYPVDD